MSLLYEFYVLQDTCTGLLLGGIGQIDAKRNTNYFVVEKGVQRCCSSWFNLAYIDTSLEKVEEVFKGFLNRPDIAIIIINQHVPVVVVFLHQLTCLTDRRGHSKTDNGAWPTGSYNCYNSLKRLCIRSRKRPRNAESQGEYKFCSQLTYILMKLILYFVAANVFLWRQIRLILVYL